MKTTRILGFTAGLMAVLSAIAIALSLLSTANSIGFYLLGFGIAFILTSAIPGVAHLILRIWFRRPFHDPDGPRGFLITCRVMVWLWAILLVGAVFLVILNKYYEMLFAMI